MSRLMLDFLNTGFRKTAIIIMLNIMPKHPKAMTNTPLTIRSNHSVESGSLSSSIFLADKGSKQNIATKSLVIWTKLDFWLCDCMNSTFGVKNATTNYICMYSLYFNHLVLIKLFDSLFWSGRRENFCVFKINLHFCIFAFFVWW